MRNRLRSPFTLAVLLCVAVALAGCGAKGTPVFEGLRDTQQKLKDLSASAARTNETAVTRCTAAARAADVKLNAACAGWSAYLPQFQTAYTKADADWSLAASSGNLTLQRDVDARVKALQNKVNEHAGKLQ